VTIPLPSHGQPDILVSRNPVGKLSQEIPIRAKNGLY